MAAPKIALLVFLCISIRSGASGIEPTDPVSGCDRYVSPVAMEDCRKLHKKLSLDWYAAAVCARMDDDDAYRSCLLDIDGRKVAPRVAASCLGEDIEDRARFECLRKGLAGRQSPSDRQPAAVSKKTSEIYQPIQITPRARD